MKRWIPAIGIIALFIGMICIPAGATTITENTSSDGPGWHFLVFGKISKYEFLEYNGTEYIHARAVKVIGLFWNVSKKYPNLILPSVLRNTYFNLPTENVEIDIWPTAFGNYYNFRAKGTMEF